MRTAVAAIATERGILARRLAREALSEAGQRRPWLPPPPIPELPSVIATDPEVELDDDRQKFAREYRRCVRDMSVPSCPDGPRTWKDIAKSVSRAHGFTLHDLIGPGRTRTLVVARQEAIWRIRHELEPQPSLPLIGQRMGGRDHTTIMHSLRRYEKRLAEQAKCSP